MPRREPEKLGRGLLIIASVVVIGAIMCSLSTIQWVATGYLVALATVIPMTGWASERFGAKRLWMTVVGLFVVGSALSGLAWNAESLILQNLSWRWIFYVNLPIGALALGLAWKLLPHSDPQPGERLGLSGLALLSPGLAGVMFGLSETSGGGGIGSPLVWGAIRRRRR